ncbi:MAG: hypothetical protein RLZZ488_2810 [Pseudomonadota bacterium]|jgi:hypothetical protein
MSVFFFVTALLLIGCATYTDQTAAVRNKLVHGQSQEALETLEKSPIATRKRDEVLFRMERGMLHYLGGDYEKAVKDWEKSFYRSEELYTLSISKTAASLAVSEDLTDYEGEEHERVLIPIFSSLSFFAMGNLGAALVEIRRAYNLISKLKLDTDNKSPRIDGFPFFVSGLLYESNANWDAAIIEYRKALKFYRTDQWPRHNVDRLVADSLWRVAEFRGRSEITRELEDSGFQKPKDTLRERMSQGEVILVFESGQSPIKVARDYPIDHSTGIVNISFPAYQAITRSNPSVRISCDGKECERTSKASDVAVLAERALEHRRLKDIAKMTARLIVKQGSKEAARKHFGELGGIAVMLANAATERADTRSWTLLPENIQIARVVVPPDQTIKLSVDAQNIIEGGAWSVKVPVGKKKLLRVRSMY